MLKREKDTHTIFTQAMTRNLAFLRIQTGLEYLTEYIDYSYDDHKSIILKQIPESLRTAPIYTKVKDCGSAYGLIDCLDKKDIPHIVENIGNLPFGDTIQNVIPEELIDVDVVTMYLPMIKEGVQLIRDNPLYGDILVMQVTAFEVYLRDTLHDLIVNNEVIAKRFVSRVKNFKNIGEYLDLNRSTSLLIAADVTQRKSFYNMTNIEGLFQTCFYKPGEEVFRIHPKNRKIESVNDYLKLRHILVHNGGLVDQRYIKDVSKCKYALGERYEVQPDEVMELDGLTRRMVRRIEEAIVDY
jgi:hypothetical protein